MIGSSLVGGSIYHERLGIHELGMSGSKYTSLAKCMAMIQHWRALVDDRFIFGGWLNIPRAARNTRAWQNA